MLYRGIHRLIGVLVAAVSSMAALAQPCIRGQWLPGDPLAGTNGYINDMKTWDPDGPGPLPPQLVVWGSFTVAGNTRASNIAMRGGAQWTSLSPSSTPYSQAFISALCVMPNNDLIAAGVTNNLMGVPTSQVARYHGGRWTDLQGLPPSSYVYSAVGLSDDRVAVGTDTGIYLWNGVAWTTISPIPRSACYALAILQDGRLVAATGESGGTVLIRAWNGASWTAIGGFSGAGNWCALLPLANGDLLAGGYFTSISGVPARYIARWNGSAWSPLGGGPTVAPVDMEILPDGDLIVTGPRVGGLSASTVARWDGSQWSAISNVDFGNYYSIATMPDGSLAYGGQFQRTDIGAFNIVRLVNNQWAPLMPGNDGAIQALLAGANGNLIAGGSFGHIGSIAASRLARRIGGSWQPFPTGPDNGTVYALALLPNSDLVAAGSLFSVASQSVSNIIRFNGTAWQQVGDGLDNAVYALAITSNGDVIAGGAFTSSGTAPTPRVARYHGAWSALGSIDDGEVRALQVMPNGDVIAGGSFTAAGGRAVAHIARWDGAAWQTLGTGVDNAVYALALLDNGDLVVGGSFATAGGVASRGIARWDGTAWSGFGSGVLGPPNNLGPTGSVLSLTPLPSNQLIAGGSFTSASGVPANRIARWIGDRWIPFDGGTSGSVLSLTALPAGGLAAAGNFLVAGDTVSAFFATWSCYQCATADFNNDGDTGTDADIEAFFACLAGRCCPACPPNADFDGDGDVGTDADIEAFFRVLAGNPC